MATYVIPLPDYGSRRQSKARVLEARFGDGYVQRIPDGLNSIGKSWPLNWTLRTRAEITALEGFLESQAGRPFSWTDPKGEVGRWTCDDWESNYDHPTMCSMSATFVRFYG